LAVGSDGFGSDLHHLARIMFVFGEGEDANAHALRCRFVSPLPCTRGRGVGGESSFSPLPCTWGRGVGGEGVSLDRRGHKAIKDAIACAAQESEIAHTGSENVHLLPIVAEATAGDDAAGAGDLLIGRQRGADAIMSRLVEERLMPRQ